tara:strand:- start:218 stop:415 length:198 start_codon:yes stop_codon:yes gene_type:complete
MHNVEDYYRKIEFLHTRALELHRERYKKTGDYDKLACKILIDDIKYLALMIAKSEIDLEKEFGKK